MSDRRHQRDGRNDWNNRFQRTARQIYGFWTFYKMNLATNQTQTISENLASLEIRNAKFPKIMSEKNSEIVNAFLEFNPIEEMKRGEQIEINGFLYWGNFTVPAKAEFAMQAAA